MTESLRWLTNLPIPLPQLIADKRANCFNAVKFYFDKSTELSFMGPEDFVRYLQSNFTQALTAAPHEPLNVIVIWSRNSDVLPIGTINIDRLTRDEPGYPFGLVIEHAFVQLDSSRTFQKRDPSPAGPYEIISTDEALAPYRNRKGFEITLHRIPRHGSP